MSALDSDVIRRERQPMRCSAAFLPLLCWERSVRRFAAGAETWNRDRAQNAFAEHVAAGTPDMQEAEITFDVGYPVTLREYWEAGLEWPGFEVAVEMKTDRDPPSAGDVLSAALARKNVRDMPHLRYQAPPARVVFGAALTVGGNVQIRPAQ